MRRVVFLLLCLFVTLSAYCQKGDTYVVVVGISNYKTITDLRLPEKDAKAIADLYKTHTKNVILITGKYATKSRILKSLKEQFARAKENDMVVFSFSGHGYPGGVCPYDMTAKEESGVSYNEIRAILKQSRAKQKIVFADACFSGAIRTNKTNSNNHSNNDPSVLLFLSSRGGETSLESPFMQNGFFTTFLLRGLRGGADVDRNRKITAKELFKFVSEGVKEKSKDKQHPVMWGKFSDDYTIMDWN